MDPVVHRPSGNRVARGWINLFVPRRKREPRPRAAAGVWVVDASEKASPQQRTQPRIARGLLSTSFPERSGLPSKGFSPTVPLRSLRGRYLRVSRLRPRPTLLQLAVPAPCPQSAMPGLQPSLPADRPRPKVSCRAASPLSKPGARRLYRAKSDGSFSCFFIQTWQSNAGQS